MSSTTFGRGGTKQEKIKKSNEHKAAEKLHKALSAGNEMTGIDKIRYDLATLKRQLLAADYDRKYAKYGSLLDAKIVSMKAEYATKEKELQQAIIDEKAQIFICWDCHREFNKEEDIDEHDCPGKK